MDTNTSDIRQQLSKNISAMAAIYRRIDGGQLTGRNGNLTAGSLATKWATIQRLLDECGGYEILDNDPKLAARFDKIEWRHLVGTRPSITR